MSAYLIEWISTKDILRGQVYITAQTVLVKNPRSCTCHSLGSYYRYPVWWIEILQLHIKRLNRSLHGRSALGVEYWICAHRNSTSKVSADWHPLGCLMNGAQHLLQCAGVHKPPRQYSEQYTVLAALYDACGDKEKVRIEDSARRI